MHICYVCNEYPEGPHGGVGTMTQLLAEELFLKGHSIKIVGVYDQSYPAADFEVKNGVQVTRIKVNKKNKFAIIWGYWLVSKTIRKWIKKGEVDIIECPDSYGMLSFFIPSKKPVVLRANGNNTYFSSILKTPLRKNTAFYERNLYRKATGYCAVSAYTANKMKALYDLKEPITVIYNAVEIKETEFKLTDKYKNIEERPNPIIFSGTLTHKKGIYQLVEAVIILLKKNINVTLFINGKDAKSPTTGLSVKQELLQLIPKELSANFVFNGHVTRRDLFSQYQYAKMAIFPSYAEAFALAPMEAMTLGIPVIFSKTCSGKELIDDKIDGLLIDPSSEYAIAHAIEFMIQDPLRATEIGQKGKAKILQRFSKETMANQSLKFYKKILNSVLF